MHQQAHSSFSTIPKLTIKCLSYINLSKYLFKEGRMSILFLACEWYTCSCISITVYESAAGAWHIAMAGEVMNRTEFSNIGSVGSTMLVLSGFVVYNFKIMHYDSYT